MIKVGIRQQLVHPFLKKEILNFPTHSTPLHPMKLTQPRPVHYSTALHAIQTHHLICKLVIIGLDDINKQYYANYYNYILYRFETHLVPVKFDDSDHPSSTTGIRSRTSMQRCIQWGGGGGGGGHCWHPPGRQLCLERRLHGAYCITQSPRRMTQ